MTDWVTGGKYELTIEREGLGGGGGGGSRVIKGRWVGGKYVCVIKVGFGGGGGGGEVIIGL